MLGNQNKETEKPELEEQVDKLQESLDNGKERKQEISIELITELIELAVKKALTEMYIPIRIAEPEEQNKMVLYGNFVTLEDLIKISIEHGYQK